MSDHLFPRYHVRPARGYLNDPNGPIVVDGCSHLYFQYRHTVDLDAPVEWAHVTSDDLVHWRYHRPAMAPHPFGDDRDGCWSGNTVVDASGNVRAFYSGFVADEPLQRTLVATSTDGGSTFGEPRVAVPAPAAAEGVLHLRDPFVWREGDTWRMALGAGVSGAGDDGSNDGTAMVRLYESRDLETWTPAGLLGCLPRTRTGEWDSGCMWECPQILRYGARMVALVGGWSPETGVMRVLSFVAPDAVDPDVDPSSLSLVDRGPNFYAASVMPESPLGPLMWGWATEGRAWNWCEADGWSGTLTLPRLVSLRPDGSLASAPLPALSSLRTSPEGRPVDGELDGLPAQLEFALDASAASGPCRLRLRFGAEEYLDIIVDAVAGTVVVDREHASADPRADGGVSAASGLDGLRNRAGEGSVRGFMDGSILELFVPDGPAFTVRMYPTTPPPWRVELSGDPDARAMVWEQSRF